MLDKEPNEPARRTPRWQGPRSGRQRAAREAPGGGGPPCAPNRSEELRARPGAAQVRSNAAPAPGRSPSRFPPNLGTSRLWTKREGAPGAAAGRGRRRLSGLGRNPSATPLSRPHHPGAGRALPRAPDLLGPSPSSPRVLPPPPDPAPARFPSAGSAAAPHPAAGSPGAASSAGPRPVPPAAASYAPRRHRLRRHPRLSSSAVAAAFASVSNRG